MERFRDFIGAAVKRERIDAPGALDRAELCPRYLPDAFEPFDEMEFLAPYREDAKLVLSIALEEGRIMRILLGWAGPDEEEDGMRPLDPEAMASVLSRHGDRLVGFFREITACDRV